MSSLISVLRPHEQKSSLLVRVEKSAAGALGNDRVKVRKFVNEFTAAYNKTVRSLAPSARSNEDAKRRAVRDAVAYALQAVGAGSASVDIEHIRGVSTSNGAAAHFDSAVATMIAANPSMTLAEASTRVSIDQPQVRSDFVAEANANRSAKREADRAVVVAARAKVTSARDQWEAAVIAVRSANPRLSFGAAAAQVDRRSPELRRALLQTANEERPDVVLA
jgi:hypothetical protein